MIIQLEGAAAEELGAAKDSLAEMTRGWGSEVGEVPAAEPADGDGVGWEDVERGIDPVALASLIVSIPSTVLAVMDLADRIKKRQRATELIDQAHALAGQGVIARVVTEVRTVELRTLTPDQLLELVAGEGGDPAS